MTQTPVEKLHNWHARAAAARRLNTVRELRLTLQDLAFDLKREIDRRTGEGLGDDS